MKVTTEELGSREVLIKVEFDESEKAEALKEAARIISSEINIPGFRRGKAPYDVVRRMVGERLIYEVAFEETARKIYPKLISDLNLDPIAPAQIQEAVTEPFSITLKVPLKPIVDLGDYRSLRVKKGKAEVSEEEVQKALNELLEERATWITVERSASEGDLIVADLTIKTPTQESHRENVVLFLNSEKEPISGLTRNLEGLSSGQEKTFTLQGEEGEITFQVKVHEVKEKQLPPLDDEFARSFGDFSSLEELKEHVRKEILAQKEVIKTDEALTEALDTLVKNARVEVPSLLIEREAEEWLKEEDINLRKRGLSLENYLKIQGKTLEEHRQEILPKAMERLKRRLVLQKFVEEENLSVSEEEINKVVREFEANVTSKREKRSVRSPELRESIANMLWRAKLEKRLIEVMVKEEADESGSDNPNGD